MQHIETKSPNFAIRAEFADGYYAGRNFEFSSSELISLWSLIEVAASLSSEMFFEIRREDVDFALQVFYENDEFCAFQDTHQHKILILGGAINQSDMKKHKQVWDSRWPLTYFLPLKSFLDFEELTKLVNDVLITGQLGDHFEFSQSFPDLGLPDGYC